MAGNYKDNIINNNIFFPELINKPKNKKKILKLNLKKENENLLIKKNQTVYLNISKSTKSLDLIFEDSTSKVVIYNSNLKEINIKSIYLKPSSNNSEIRYDRNLLTGCLTIVDSELSKVNLYSNNAQCEDAINLIRSKGDIEKVSIKNSFSDALDLDFTNIKINEAEIVNSGNDCIDFSGGKNLLINVNVTSCGDKGLSFGEKTKTSVTNVIAKKNTLDFTVKDDSEVRIKNYSSDKNESQICVSVENKKQEFGSGNLFISNINNKCKFLKDETSNIIKNATY